MSDEILVLGREFLQPIPASTTSTSKILASKSISAEDEDKYIPLAWLEEGMPISLLQTLRQSAIPMQTASSLGNKVKELVVPLTSESWETQTILKYSPNEKARERAYLISNSQDKPMEKEKVKILETLLRRRAELAKVTGNDGSYSRMTLGDKMAKRPGEESIIEGLFKRGIRPTDSRVFSVSFPCCCLLANRTC